MEWELQVVDLPPIVADSIGGRSIGCENNPNLCLYNIIIGRNELLLAEVVVLFVHCMHDMHCFDFLVKHTFI